MTYSDESPLVLDGGVWKLKEAAAGGGGSTGMPGVTAAASIGTIAGPAIGSGAVTDLASGLGPTGARSVALLNLPAANLDTSDKVLGTAALKLNLPSNSNDRLLTSYSPLFDFEYNDPFSVSFWAKTTATTDYMVAHMDVALSYRGWSVSVGSSVAEFYHIGSWSGAYLYKKSSTTINDGNWHHIVVTKNNTATYAGVEIYVDGSTDSTTTGAVETLGTTSTAHTGVLYVGARQNGSSYQYPYAGHIDDVAIWDVELSPANVTALYNSGTGALANTVLPGNLVAYYPFDTSTTSRDMSGNDLYLEFST